MAAGGSGGGGPIGEVARSMFRFAAPLACALRIQVEGEAFLGAGRRAALPGEGGAQLRRALERPRGDRRMRRRLLYSLLERFLSSRLLSSYPFD